MFPLYSLFAFIVLHMFMYAANVYFWRRYRVNYPFIFGFKEGSALGYREVLNVLLRLAWLQTVLDFQVSFLHKQTLITIVASLEIIRRGIWNFFRLENEHLNNVGKYRAFKSVPLPFHYDEDEDKEG
ncbi:hypothetical protein POM88_014269 [Heracleum sosnowskyi]|uniref:EXS domain-containing protein n=1 Tax=Heracleum sosnowskyi TaxID=360622 RepID=A0AAD8J1D2_9APIA|nr:hypothetical protein POM88_014269 [Heracleum sosnowskyi]